MKKLTVIKVPPHQYHPILALCYESDPEFLEKYCRNSPVDIVQCVELGVAEFKAAVNFTMYSLFDGESLVGYFGREVVGKQEFLHGFFIKPEYRSKDMLKTFWKIVKSKFSGEITCGLYSVNTRAQKAVKKAGFKFQYVQDGKHPFVVFKL